MNEGLPQSPSRAYNTVVTAGLLLEDRTANPSGFTSCMYVGQAACSCMSSVCLNVSCLATAYITGSFCALQAVVIPVESVHSPYKIAAYAVLTN